jgi:hypothetical protein
MSSWLAVLRAWEAADVDSEPEGVWCYQWVGGESQTLAPREYYGN